MITVRVSDMILDSRIGALDRTLGFLFGLGRGLIIVVVAFLFFTWLVPRPASRPGAQAKSLRALQLTGNWLQACCRRTWTTPSPSFRNRRRAEEQEPPDAAARPEVGANAPATTGSVKQGYQRPTAPTCGS